jgi:DNA sulfur modification protein DndD
MRIQELSLKNFRAFEGEHVLDLRSARDDELVLVFGENMSGKTSLFLALHYCLYGRALGRQGEEIPIFSPGSDATNYLINALAVENADYEMLVRLEFDHGGRRWILERKALCEGDPLEGEPFREKQFLRIDGAQQFNEEIRQLVNQVLHEEAAQFYFFDGELLSQYERWLEDPRQREGRVRQAVERTIGIVALRLYTEIDQVAQDFEAAQRKLLAREKRADQLVLDLEAVSERIRELVDEIAGYDAEEERLGAEAIRIEREHGELSDFVQEQGRLDEIARQIDQANEEIRVAEAEIRSLLHDRYWLPVAARADEVYATLMAQLKSALASPEEEVRGALVETSLDGDQCTLCEQPLATVARSRLSGMASDLALSSVVRLDVEGVQRLVVHLQDCDSFRQSGELDRLRDFEVKVVDAKSRLSALEDQDAQIRAEHARRPRGDREEQMELLKGIQLRLGSTRDKRDQAIAELANQRDLERSLQQKANRIKSDPTVQLAARISRLAVTAFENAIEGFRESARLRVEKGASEVFGELVTEPGYAGITIDRDYRVTTVDAEGNHLPIPSAGGQQLLTLALIGGLNAAAVNVAPIVMDTPAGRLDKRNRENILRWVQNLDRQVVLMVHSGELTAEDVLGMGIDVARTFRIEKIGAKSSAISSGSKGSA